MQDDASAARGGGRDILDGGFCAIELADESGAADKVNDLFEVRRLECAEVGEGRPGESRVELMLTLRPAPLLLP